ncbi:MetQ/NlpA family ABC transporter substrate-binding protein [Companilactobacillus pabuli]|jgi:D-methionine transport system substrate-binding protein|uniref:MetQ/NlpA family ABC transporter substrate-binding protein n=1 Tax=Companilactobacillus pabuli TaxID=2714036 RepID=UPI00065B2642|nr:MetQ/NlpA family ABC transporter substrate-binding protein [Companilactobacillus pabuli]AKP02237.1 metal ABC transporter substrate-binding protein [Companilactobacillus farciminis]AKS50534.1 metal ABC transporter substrate-binding protein [Companilactobacillus farciminis]MDG5113629.1 MetQ/NlpA family ABC transporter substrate-binding protein [Companilactobacillus pabuli]
MLKNRIKGILLIFITTLSLFILAGCGGNQSSSKTVKVGITGANDPALEKVKEIVKKEGINIKIVQFSDYSQPNTALANGEIDMNDFQTYTFQSDWNKKHKTNIVTLGTTVIAPMSLFSKKITKLSQLKKGDKVAIPNDVTNEGRALQLLESAGLIELDNSKIPNLRDIKKYNVGIKISSLDAGQTAKSLDDVTAACVNSGVASDAKLNPKDAIYREKITAKSKPYVNILSTNAKDKDNPTFKKIVKAYHTKEVANVIKKQFHGYESPAWTYKILQ